MWIVVGFFPMESLPPSFDPSYVRPVGCLGVLRRCLGRSKPFRRPTTNSTTPQSKQTKLSKSLLEEIRISLRIIVVVILKYEFIRLYDQRVAMNKTPSKAQWVQRERHICLHICSLLIDGGFQEILK